MPLYLVSRMYFGGQRKLLKIFSRWEYAKAYIMTEAYHYSCSYQGARVIERKHLVMVERPSEQHGVTWKIEKVFLTNLD